MNKHRRRYNRWLLFWQQEGKCCYCEQPMTLSFSRHDNVFGNSATLEHLKRRADGGGSTRSNLALACRDCNNRRGVVDWLTYASLRRDKRMV
jgi:5-methylcytosine-specific restriction endonuclease McrA